MAQCFGGQLGDITAGVGDVETHQPSAVVTPAAVVPVEQRFHHYRR